MSALVNGRLTTGRADISDRDRRRFADVRHPAGVCRRPAAADRAGGNGDRKCRPRLLPGGRRDGTGGIVPRQALGLVIGTFSAVSRAAIIAGAVLAAVLVASTSLRASLVILGVVALSITLLCGLGLRGLDALNARRADALASRVQVLEGLPVTVGVPQIVLEQLAAAAEFRPLAPGVDVVASGHSGACLLRRRGRPRRGAPGRQGRRCIRVPATASASAACSTGPPERHGHDRDEHDVAPRRRTRVARRPRGGARACGRRSISAAPRPEYRSRPKRDCRGGRSALGEDVTFQVANRLDHVVWIGPVEAQRESRQWPSGSPTSTAYGSTPRTTR